MNGIINLEIMFIHSYHLLLKKAYGQNKVNLAEDQYFFNDLYLVKRIYHTQISTREEKIVCLIAIDMIELMIITEGNFF